MRGGLGRCVLMLISAAAAAGQDRPAFDVVSLKHAGDLSANRGNMRPFGYTPSSFSCRTTLWSILMEAYQIKPYQLQGPNWIQSEVYEINARMPEGTSRETARLMVQTALADRMAMKVRQEQKEYTIYRMVVIPETNKLQKVESDHGFGLRIGSTMLESQGMTMQILANALTRAAGRPVLDYTGQEGYYKVSLHWDATPNPADGGGGLTPLGTDAGMLSAIKDMGLKLEPAKKVMESVIVERLNKEPTEN